mmetsp:Transcript_55497/g.91814  ORF Transcript_55497/g.91814 Transcript_55497/m.91814 type:complete len:286 (-) Transcript_55497:35-892(-)
MFRLCGGHGLSMKYSGLLLVKDALSPAIRGLRCAELAVGVLRAGIHVAQMPLLWKRCHDAWHFCCRPFENWLNNGPLRLEAWQKFESKSEFSLRDSLQHWRAKHILGLSADQRQPFSHCCLTALCERPISCTMWSSTALSLARSCITRGAGSLVGNNSAHQLFSLWIVGIKEEEKRFYVIDHKRESPIGIDLKHCFLTLEAHWPPRERECRHRPLDVAIKVAVRLPQEALQLPGSRACDVGGTPSGCLAWQGPRWRPVAIDHPGRPSALQTRSATIEMGDVAPVR